MDQPGGKVCEKLWYEKLQESASTFDVLCRISITSVGQYSSTMANYHPLISLWKKKHYSGSQFQGVSPGVPTAFAEAAHDCWRMQWTNVFALVTRKQKEVGERLYNLHPHPLKGLASVIQDSQPGSPS